MKAHNDEQEKWIYSKDFWILVQIFENDAQNITLVENLNIETLFGLKIHLIPITKSMTSQQITSYSKEWPEQCYKTTFQWVRNEREVNFKKFGVEFLFEFNRTLDDLHRVAFAVTSEKNSYGVVKQKWFDGKTMEECKMISEDGTEEQCPNLEIDPFITYT